MLRTIRNAASGVGGKASAAFAEVIRVPEAEIYGVDVSFAAVPEVAERDYLIELPTSFSLSPEAVDRRRAAASRTTTESPAFQRFLRDAGFRMVRD